MSKLSQGLLVSGHAIAVVNLYDIKKREKDYEWRLNNVRFIKPIAIKGQQRLFNVDDNLIEYIDISDFNELLEYWDSLGLIDINLFEEV